MPPIILAYLILAIVCLLALIATVFVAARITEETRDSGDLLAGIIFSVIAGILVVSTTGPLLAEILVLPDIAWILPFFVSMFFLEPAVYFGGFIIVVFFETSLKVV